MNKQTIIIDRLKIIAMFLVIIGHTTRIFTNSGVYSSIIQENYVLKLITDVIYSFHMPLFILLSGYVYGICAEKGKDYATFIPFIKKKALRLLAPYFFWGIIYVAPIMVLLSLTPYTYTEYVKLGILLGTNSRHLWFLLTLFEIFIVSQAVRMIIYKLKIFKKYPVVVCYIVLIFATLFRMFPTPYIFQLSSLCNYLVYFLAGYYFEKSIKSTHGVFFAIASIMALICNLSTIVFWGISIFIVIANFVKFEKLQLFQTFKVNSMGIYILHPMILYIFFFYYRGSFNPYFFTIVAFTLATIFSLLIANFLRKLSLSFLFGE